jgi:hypothetical protein
MNKKKEKKNQELARPRIELGSHGSQPCILTIELSSQNYTSHLNTITNKYIMKMSHQLKNFFVEPSNNYNYLARLSFILPHMHWLY